MCVQLRRLAGTPVEATSPLFIQQGTMTILRPQLLLGPQPQLQLALHPLARAVLLWLLIWRLPRPSVGGLLRRFALVAKISF